MAAGRQASHLWAGQEGAPGAGPGTQGLQMCGEDRGVECLSCLARLNPFDCGESASGYGVPFSLHSHPHLQRASERSKAGTQAPPHAPLLHKGTQGVQRPSPLPEAALSFVVLIHLLILFCMEARDPFTKVDTYY